MSVVVVKITCPHCGQELEAEIQGHSVVSSFVEICFNCAGTMSVELRPLAVYKAVLLGN